MKTLLLVVSLIISSARSHYNYNHADNRNSEAEASSNYNNQPIRKPTYHHYPMTFFSQQSAYSYQTTSKPYYATTSSLAVSGPTPYWYHPSPSLYVRPGVVYEYQFHGPPQPIIQDRYSKVISPFTLSAELAEPIEEVDPATEAVDSHLLEASAVTIESADDTSSTDATVVQVSTDLFDDELTTPAEDVTTPLEQVDELIKMESTTIPDDITTTQQPDTLTTESPVTFERHQQSIIPFYLRPSSWRARSFGPDPRYYQPNHYYGPEEARDLPSI
ncbi:hypothetical protein DAPPUDRAFT_330513 [Daphnia pulex]|uniref:Uncharacterized protein n=1 Tax=Daphnia pulex TaxID=6669 RepID=E9HJT1_DAPPU|nr:hypothetical protein DAPPUDRAFT_330513 [Daphnia pulex]|eukprot:EFX67992.1 hypothetical protein DAPPUDRAFT_330513 [Daphnia pulex]